MVDEINRASPRTQSSLLESMAEGQVTIDGFTHSLERSFFLIATQNPIEMAGTFPLPEAQLDRFLVSMNLGYPSYEDEVNILEREEHADPLDSLQPLIELADILALQEAARAVDVVRSLKEYIVQLVTVTRTHPDLDLLDRQAAPEVTRQRAGVGYEVIGVRPFRPGDSAQHTHWRSVARTGELISKEFADEAQPGLTLLLDLFQHPFPQTDSKHTPFEWMVKAAASIADYARRKGYPLYILADDEVLPIPSGAVAWSALLQYFARIQSTGKRPLSQVLGRQLTPALFAAILPWPDAAIMESFVQFHHNRAEILAVVLDAESFPAGGESATSFAMQIEAIGIETRLVRYGDDWTTQLEARIKAGRRLT